MNWHLKKNIKVAIDFGTTNTDLIINTNKKFIYNSFPSLKKPSIEFLKKITEDINKENIEYFAFTGGHHYLFKNNIFNQIPVVNINEIDAIGSGGFFLSKSLNLKSALIVSAGTGIACVYAHNNSFTHIAGTSVGGGTLLGLSKLLLNTIDPKKIDMLALKGNSKNTDYILKEIVTGKIGNLKSYSTAINFGKVAFKENRIEKKDIAAGLISLLSQSIIRTITHSLNLTKT